MCVAAKVNVVAILGLGWYWIGADLVLGSETNFGSATPLPQNTNMDAPCMSWEGGETYRLALPIPDHVSDLLQHMANALASLIISCYI